MANFKKNDIVIINVNDDIWNNREGYITDIIDETEETPLYLVKIQIVTEDGSERFITQAFSADQLVIKSTVESINETIDKTMNEILLGDRKAFIEYFLGQKVKFKGLVYTDIFDYTIDKNDTVVFSAADQEQINYYEKLKGKIGNISACVISDDFDSDSSSLENFNACFWDVLFDDDLILNAIPGSLLKLVDMTNTQLTEAKEKKKKLQNIISKYLSKFSETSSWCLANTIAHAEGLSIDEVLKIAKKFNYKIFKLRSNVTPQFIIATETTTKDQIKKEYGDFTLEKISIIQL